MDGPAWVRPMGRHILLIGEGLQNGRDVADVLQAEGWECLRAATAQAGLEQLADTVPDLVIVDTRVADMAPGEVCARVRATAPVPLAVLDTGVAEGGDRGGALACLQKGADVCLRPKDGTDLLVAQVRAQLRRATQYCGPFHSRGVLDYGELRIDLDGRTVFLRDGQVPMACKEFDLLSALAIHEGHVMQASDLLEQVWGYAKDCRTRTLEVHICRLRAKLEADPANPQIILTVPCVGYRFCRP